MEAVGLYLHIPFCAKKCGYCDFASYAGQEALWQPVLAAMQAEMELRAGLFVGTVYVGGGTPTVWPAEMLTELLSSARQRFDIAQDAEITVEANPGTVDDEKLAALRAAGVNRLSFGAQAMQPELLETLGRIHRWEDVEVAVRMARGAGFQNINIDMMYGLPGQTPAMFRRSMEAMLALSPEHASIYSLILEDGTPFHTRYDGHPEAFAHEDDIAEMSDDALWMAEDAGLRRYEISNYAKEGFESRHNLGYWLRRDYLGIGCAAHSLLQNRRWGNARELSDYLQGKREEELAVSESEARFERLMLGLRLVEGIPWGEQVLYDQFEDKLNKLRARGLMEWDEQRVWLTKRGLDLQNRVMVELME